MVPVVLAHGDDETMDMGDGMAMPTQAPQPDLDLPPSYVAHPEHRAVLITHIALMVLAWVFVLPLGKLRDKPGFALQDSCVNSLHQPPCSP